MKHGGEDKNGSVLAWIVRNSLLVTLLLAAAVAVVAYIGGWRTLPAYGIGLK